MLHSQLTKIGPHLGSTPIDVFVCSASYEDRSLSVAQNLVGVDIGRAVTFVNRDYLPVAQTNLEKLQSVFRDYGYTYELDTNDPLFTADQVVEALSGIFVQDPPLRVVVDVTSFTRESMLILLRYLYSNRPASTSIEFVYANAGEYSVGDSVENKWLSRGHREVRSVLGYSGVLVPSRQTHLIVLVGFEDERALALVHECEPAKITLGIADESDWATGPHQDTNVHRLMRLKNMVGKVDEFTFSGYDARMTKRVTQSIVEKNQNYNTIISPMNTKISTIGAAMVALENEVVQVCYSQAEVYNVAGYSRPGEHFFHLSMGELS